MLGIEQQVKEGRLVCPVSRQRLVLSDNHLSSLDGRFVYYLSDGVPVLLEPDRQAAFLAQRGGTMLRQYTEPDRRAGIIRFFERLSFRGGDYRAKRAQRAFQETIAMQPGDALCLSIGGGPKRVHPNLFNLNIGLFPNVDVVADAYALPYADNSVDAIYCEAVLEHLEYPDKSLAEMTRVLRPGGQVLTVTPFLSMFHGYPNHYQNFTLEGHQKLLVRAGLTIVSAGVCVGPTYAILDLVSGYARYLPTRFLSRWVYRAMRLFSVAIRPIDLWLNQHPEAHVLACSTYVHAIKKVLPSA